MKNIIKDTITKLKPDLTALSLAIHQNPELAFEEHKACSFISDFLRKHGFTVETGVAGLPTAFRAEKRFGSGPTVAFIAEYDALPEIGHACGHNLIAIMAVGAGIGLSSAEGLAGTVVVMGTPAEEGLGGKIPMLEKGAFKGVDFALMIHPSGDNLVNRTSTALQHWTVEFRGKNAHSSNPQTGINALSAVMKTFENIDHLRALMPLTANVHGIVTHGGTAANIITDYAVCEFTARAKDLKSLNIVGEYMERAVKAAEILTGATATIKRDPHYAEMHSNRAISAEFKANMAELGIIMKEASNDGKYGSSDIGNVSLAMPTIHPYLDIGSNYNAHHVGFTADCITEFAHDVAIKGAMGLAMTGFDILTDTALRDVINEEFKNKDRL